MSKNTSSNAFRRIDVDQYAEDNYKVSYNCSLLVNLRFCSQIFNSTLNLKKNTQKLELLAFYRNLSLSKRTIFYMTTYFLSKLLLFIFGPSAAARKG